MISENISKQRLYVRELILNALFIALVFIATKFINIRLPISVNGGLIHMGNTVFFMIAIVFGREKGAIAGAFGMCIFDILSGWVAWAPFTFVIRGTMGFIIGTTAHSNGKKGNSIFYNVIGIIIASACMIIGYYLTEGILYGDWRVPTSSIPGNITQLVIGAVVGLPLAKIFIRMNIYKMN